MSHNGRTARASYGIAVPHLRVDALPAPELLLGLSSEGVMLDGHKVKVIVFLQEHKSDRALELRRGIEHPFFYTPLSRIYYFAPVPWHVYMFAFHGTAILLLFEEAKKYYRRKGYTLQFLG
jgi:hypothetical protein